MDDFDEFFPEIYALHEDNKIPLSSIYTEFIAWMNKKYGSKIKPTFSIDQMYNKIKNSIIFRFYYESDEIYVKHLIKRKDLPIRCEDPIKFHLNYLDIVVHAGLSNVATNVSELEYTVESNKNDHQSEIDKLKEQVAKMASEITILKTELEERKKYETIIFKYSQ